MSEDNGWRRRHALHVVTQLPDNTDDALEVLRLAREVVERFLVEPTQAPLVRAAPTLAVVCASRSRFLSDTDSPLSSPS